VPWSSPSLFPNAALGVLPSWQDFDPNLPKCDWNEILSSWSRMLHLPQLSDGHMQRSQARQVLAPSHVDAFISQG
jgi:hypothetical protein